MSVVKSTPWNVTVSALVSTYWKSAVPSDWVPEGGEDPEARVALPLRGWTKTSSFGTGFPYWSATVAVRSAGFVELAARTLGDAVRLEYCAVELVNDRPDDGNPGKVGSSDVVTLKLCAGYGLGSAGGFTTSATKIPKVLPSPKSVPSPLRYPTPKGMETVAASALSDRETLGGAAACG